jgi:RNA 2',3'-cyclic 3'-phosphodiesterase
MGYESILSRNGLPVKQEQAWEQADNVFMRLFIGIPLAAAVIDELSAAVERLRSAGDGLRWTAPESWHITLQFLGNTSPEQYQCVVARLRGLDLPPAPIELEALGCFDRTGVIFAGVRVSPELLLIQQRVIAATALCGFASEARAYQPHITLARSKGKALSRLKAKMGRHAQFTSFVAGEFLLYESFLSPTGSRYEIRERFSLDGR